MTLHKSLSKKKGAAYAFFSGIRSSMLPSIIISAVLILFMNIMPFSTLYSYENNNTGKKLKDAYKFMVFSGGSPVESAFVLVVVAILSIAVGILVFKFASDKKTVNVYYSLGIKRSALFYSRFAAGAITLCAAIILPVVLSYIINLTFLGLSWQLSVVLLYFYFGLSLFSLLCYSFTAAVFASVGTISEGVVFSVGLLAAPTVFFFSIQKIITAFLKTTTYGVQIVAYGTRNAYNDAQNNMVMSYAAYNPLLFFSKALSTYGVGTIDATTKSVKLGGDAWIFPDATVILPWFFVVLAAAIIGGVLFRHRKAENCGFLNTNKVLSNLLIFEFMIFASTLFLSQIKNNSATVVLVLCGAVACVIYIICEIFFKRSFKGIIRSFYKLPAHLAVIAVIFAIFMTGGLGYDTYIPQKAQVDSVCISLPVSLSPYSTFSSYRWNMYTDNSIVSTSYYDGCYELPEFTDSSDIDKVLSLHKALLEDKSSEGKSRNELSRVTVRYKLKNGTEKSRLLTFSSSDMAKLVLGITDAKAVDNAVFDMLNKVYVPSAGSETDSIKDEYSHPELIFTYDSAEVIAVNKSFNNQALLNLTEQEFNALKKAVEADMLSLTPEDMYFGSTEQFGVIRFCVNPDVYSENDDELNGIKDESSLADENTAEDKNEDEILPDDEILPEDDILPETDIANKKYTVTMETSSDIFNNENGVKYDFIVTSKCKNTLAFLQANGFDGCFDSDQKIKSVAFAAPTKEYFSNEFYFDFAPCKDFIAKKAELFADYNDSQNSLTTADVAENIITDTAKINELIPRLQFYAYTFDEGYYCLVEYENGSRTILYLNSALAPDYVKNFNYTMYKD